jgi:hypothetical protein
MNYKPHSSFLLSIRNNCRFLLFEVKNFKWTLKGIEVMLFWGESLNYEGIIWLI